MRSLSLILLLTGMLASWSKPSSPAPSSVTGPNTPTTVTVVERLDGPPYSYLRLATDKGEVWAAVPMDSVTKGREVTVKHGAALRNFQAPRVGRRFDLSTVPEHRAGHEGQSNKSDSDRCIAVSGARA